MARNPFAATQQVERLVADFDRLLDITLPSRDLVTPATTRAATCAKRGLLEGSADRDSGDNTGPRREELSDRVAAALTTVTDCIDGLRALERAR
ncbi:hypothetical protein JNN96_27925 [Mycobacterium sp. DSM 3803]|nr:hypothetical protein [Mycobacterium sp. DSM 3803]